MDPVIEELERLAGLLDRGLLTREQFEAQRDRLLAGAGSSPGPSASPAPPDDAAPIPPPRGGGVSDQQTALPGGAAPGLGSSPPAAGGLDDWPERLGSYRVLGVLGAGGMGTVLRARHSMEGV